MQSQKYYMSVLVSLTILQDTLDQPGVFAHLVHRFKERVAEAGCGIITRPVLRVVKPDLLSVELPPGLVRVHIIARVVPIQRLENVQS